MRSKRPCARSWSPRCSFWGLRWKGWRMRWPRTVAPSTRWAALRAAMRFCSRSWLWAWARETRSLRRLTRFLPRLAPSPGSARSLFLWTLSPIPTTCKQRRSSRSSPRPRRPSCLCTYMATARTWKQSWASRTSTAFGSSRTWLRPSARNTAAIEPARWPRPAAFRFSRARTWAASATAAWWSRTTTNWLTSFRAFACTAQRLSITTLRWASTAVSTRSRPRC